MDEPKKLTRTEQRVLADYGVCYPFDPRDMAQVLIRVEHARDIAERSWVDGTDTPIECLGHIGRLLAPPPVTRDEVREIAPITPFVQDDGVSPMAAARERIARLSEVMREQGIPEEPEPPMDGETSDDAL